MYEQGESTLPLIRCVWRATSDADGVMIDRATDSWGITFTRHANGRLSSELAGPALSAQRIEWRAGDRYWGVELRSHVFWHGLDKVAALGEFRSLPVDGKYVELGGVRFPIPEYEGLEGLVASMAAQGILVGDPLIAEALAGDEPDVSERTLQRRFVAVAGVGKKRIEQIERARRAYAMLQEGRAPADVAIEAGYSDQAHLTRSLRVFAGRTPREILTGG